MEIVHCPRRAPSFFESVRRVPLRAELQIEFAETVAAELLTVKEKLNRIKHLLTLSPFKLIPCGNWRDTAGLKR